MWHPSRTIQGTRRAPGRTVRATVRSLTGGETSMEQRMPRPDTVQALRWGADAAFALLAGLQLDVFTPLQGGPLTTAQLAEAIGVGPTRPALSTSSGRPLCCGTALGQDSSSRPSGRRQAAHTRDTDRAGARGFPLLLVPMLCGGDG